MSEVEIRAGQRITGVRRSKRDATLVVVMLDGARAGEVDAAEAERLGMLRGAVLDASMAAGLRDAIALCAARRDAVRLARARPRTRAELVQRLTERGHSAEVAVAAAERLADSGAIDERTVAEVAAIGMAERRVSRRLARDRLVQRGIDEGQAARAIERAFGDRDDLDLAIEAARRRAAAVRGLEPDAARRRLSGFLARRGYDEETCHEAVRVVLGGVE